jgi:methionyl-tRNA formyltransferase
MIRGLSPHPAAFTQLKSGDKEHLVKIYESRKKIVQHEYMPGSIKTDFKTYLHVAAEDGFVELLSLQLAGKKRMDCVDFLRGFQIENSAMFV